MEKRITLLLLILVFTHSYSQKVFEPTNEFTIKGLVESPLTISYSDLVKEKMVEIGDFKITSHTGDFKKEYKNVKGVHLLDFLNRVVLHPESPKQLNEYYFVFTASDGYSVVASWNELFNSEIGNGFFLVTEADSKSQANAQERILLISTKDIKTGRRHIRGLKTIEVRKI